MTGDEYKADIKALGLTGDAAGALLGSPRSARRWVKYGPPPAIAVLVTLLAKGVVTIGQLEAIKLELGAE